jgi:hypothetical protein
MGSSNMHFLAFSISGPPRSGSLPSPPSKGLFGKKFNWN